MCAVSLRVSVEEQQDSTDGGVPWLKPVELAAKQDVSVLLGRELCVNNPYVTPWRFDFSLLIAMLPQGG